MKSLRKLLYIIPLTGMMVTSCMDVENIEIDHIGGYATITMRRVRHIMPICAPIRRLLGITIVP